MNTVRLKGTLAKDPKVGETNGSVWCLASVETIDEQNNKLQTDFMVSRDIINVFEGKKAGDLVDMVGVVKTTFRKKKNTYETGVEILKAKFLASAPVAVVPVQIAQVKIKQETMDDVPW